jgi:SAM-dependent methyltransferase
LRPGQYQQSRELREYIAAKVGGPEAQILNIGCGNSRMAPGLYDDGYQLITNVDISTSVVRQMRAKYAKSHPGLVFVVGDGLALGERPGLAPCTFDVVVDKGTLQSLLLLRGGMAKAEQFAREVHRVLKPGGRLIEIMGSRGMQQYMQPDGLLWKVSYKSIPRDGIGGNAAVFTLTKPLAPPPDAAEAALASAPAVPAIEWDAKTGRALINLHPQQPAVSGPAAAPGVSVRSATAPAAAASAAPAPALKEHTRALVWQRLTPAAPAARQCAAEEVRRALRAATAAAGFGLPFEALYAAAAEACGALRPPELLSRAQLTTLLRDPDPATGARVFYDRKQRIFKVGDGV